MADPNLELLPPPPQKGEGGPSGPFPEIRHCSLQVLSPTNLHSLILINLPNIPTQYSLHLIKSEWLRPEKQSWRSSLDADISIEGVRFWYVSKASNLSVAERLQNSCFGGQRTSFKSGDR